MICTQPAAVAAATVIDTVVAAVVKEVPPGTLWVAGSQDLGHP